MYTVAINRKPYSQLYSVTVRDLARSPHWVFMDEACTHIRDTRELHIKAFTVLVVCDTETEARKFAATIEAAYSLVGWTKETVKVEAV